MQSNADKCKELVIDFKKNPHNFSPIVVNRKELPVSSSVKVLGVTISSNLKWNDQFTECIKKANKRLYFIVLLKRANVPTNDIVTFYCTAIRPVLEYCVQVYHHALPQYLSDDVEWVQKRVLSIISSSKSTNSECLVRFGLDTLYSRRVSLCNKLFNSIVENPGHKLFPLLPSRNLPKYNLRRSRALILPRCNTNSFKKRFISSMQCAESA